MVDITRISGGNDHQFAIIAFDNQHGFLLDAQWGVDGGSRIDGLTPMCPGDLERGTLMASHALKYI